MARVKLIPVELFIHHLSLQWLDWSTLGHSIFLGLRDAIEDPPSKLTGYSEEDQSHILKQ